MDAAAWHLAQLNIGRILAPLDSPAMAEFVAALDPVNALADASPGFIWRLVGDGNDATSLRPFDDDFMLVNISTWESLEALRAFVYSSAHTGYLRARARWVEKLTDAVVVLWWVRAGHQPSVDEARRRLDQLRAGGPTASAFTFARPFPKPADEADAA